MKNNKMKKINKYTMILKRMNKNFQKEIKRKTKIKNLLLKQPLKESKS